jgi:predicted ATP-grasp superfamily ATP-dependent carboligase
MTGRSRRWLSKKQLQDIVVPCGCRDMECVGAGGCVAVGDKELHDKALARSGCYLEGSPGTPGLVGVDAVLEEHMHELVETSFLASPTPAVACAERDQPPRMRKSGRMLPLS